jgi:uncharacterized protein
MSVDPRFGGPGPDAVYAQNLAEDRFTIQCCDACQSCQFPPTLVCRNCGAASPAFVDASGRGTVYATTTIRAKDGSRNVAIVELAEGPRLMSCVADMASEAVAIGLDLEVFIASEDQAGETRRFVAFRPAKGGA